MTRTGVVLGALLLFCCCSPRPDLVVDGMAVYYGGHPRLDAKLEVALPIIEAQARAIAPDAGRPWCADIHFEDFPFSCAGIPVAGCQNPYGSCEFYLGWKPNVDETALVFELGHLAWEIAHQDDSGETLYRKADGGWDVTVEPDFQAWVDNTQALVQDALQESP